MFMDDQKTAACGRHKVRAFISHRPLLARRLRGCNGRRLVAGDELPAGIASGKGRPEPTLDQALEARRSYKKTYLPE